MRKTRTKTIRSCQIPVKSGGRGLALWLTLTIVFLGSGVCEAGLKIYYIHHAESGHNVLHYWEDSGVPQSEWPDYVGDAGQLTPLGLAQRELVSAKLQEFEYRFDFIAASSLWGTQNTVLPYMQETGSTGEIWPELSEMYISSDYILSEDLPTITDPILGQGSLITLPIEEAQLFSIRADGTHDPSIPDYGDDELSDAAAKIIVCQATVDLILERFDRTEKSILLAGHSTSGENLIRKLTNDSSWENIDNTGIWMVEQQADGTFKAMIYNSVFLEEGADNTGSTTVRFNDTWMTKPYATENVTYSEALVKAATGDSLSYSKVAGPDWLMVTTNGTLGGIPSASDIGTNSFEIQVKDVSGTTDQMTLVIVVLEEEETAILSADNLNYTFLFYENGAPHGVNRRPSSEDNLLAQANPDLVIQTGYYSIMLDCDDMQIKGYDALAGSGYVQDLEKDVTGFTPADLELSVTVDGVVYTCTGAASEPQLVRLIESSRYIQRFDHLGLIFEDSSGNVLTESGRFEMTAWSDRVVFKLDFSGVSGVTETVVSVVSPLSVLHEKVEVGDSAVLAIQPHLDTTLEAWDVNDYVIEAIVKNSSQALNVEFDNDEYAIHIDVPSSAVSYPKDNDRVDEFVIEITNPGSSAENIPLVFDQPSPRTITGTVMTLCEEEDGRPLGIPVQISKNWHGSSTDLVHRGSWLRGNTVLNLEAGETRRFRLRVIFGYWADAGAVSHSQLSLIGWGRNWKWDESALGAWGESCTYDPTMHAGGAVICDVRPAFTGTEHAWTGNFGGGDNLIYNDSDGTYRHVKRVKTAYRWVGPNMTEVLYSGVTDDNKIRYTYTARAVRTNDYHRRFHRYKYEFLEDVISPQRLVFHQMAADQYHNSEYTDYHIGAEFGLIASAVSEAGGDVYKGAPVAFNDRWLAIDDVTHDDGTVISEVNRGILSLSSTLNGTRFPLYLHKYGNTYGSDTMSFDLSSDAINNSYSAGDVVEGEVEFIMTPKTADFYWGSDAELTSRLDTYGSNTWETVHDEARYNVTMDVTVNAGSLLCNYPVEIQASTTSAEVLAQFTIDGGGIGHVPVVIKGIKPGLALHAQYLSAGVWTPIDTTDLFSNDDYQAYNNSDGTMDAVFNITRPSLDLEERWDIRILSGVNYDEPITISPAGSGSGYDIPEAEAIGFRSTSISKSYDADGDDAYGTAGYYFYGNGADTSNNSDGTPTWVTEVGVGATSLYVVDSFTDFDNPTLGISSTVADWTFTGIGRADTESTAGGLWAELLTFSVDSTAPRSFRLGVMSGNHESDSDGRWDPSSLRLSFNGETAIKVTGLEETRLGMVFFDVTLPEGAYGGFSIEGQAHDLGENTKGSSLAGITFDEIDPDLSGYKKWLIDNTGLTDEAIIGDSDNDGVANILEYALNGDPYKADPSILPSAVITTDGFLFTFERNTEALVDTTMIFQYSSSLSSNDWTEMEMSAAEVTIGAEVNGIQSVGIIISDDAAIGKKLFARIKVNYKE